MARKKKIWDVSWIEDWSVLYGARKGTTFKNISRVFSVSKRGAKRQIKKRKGFMKLIGIKKGKLFSKR